MVHTMYCVKCKRKNECVNVKEEHDKRGKPRMHGKCKKCGTHCYQYIKSKGKQSKSRKSRSKSRKSRSKSRKSRSKSRKLFLF